MGFGPFSSESNSRTDTTTQNAAFSEIGGAATSLNVKAGKRSVVQALDGGAVAGALDLTRATTDAALRQVELAGSRSADLVRESVAAVAEGARSETENVSLTAIKWGALAAVALAAVGMFRKG